MFEFTEKVVCPQDTKILKQMPLMSKLYQEKYDIIRKYAPGTERILEIGVRAGYSAWTFLQAFPEATYVGLDPHNGTHGGAGGENGLYEAWAKDLLAGYNISLERQDTQIVQDITQYGMFDFIHIDGDHTAAGVYHDLDICYPILAEGGSISVDDYTYLPEVKEGVDKWLAEKATFIRAEFLTTVRGDVLIQARG